MTWLLSLLIAVLIGAFAMLCGGLVMAGYARWHNVSNFEGKAGFAIMGVALLSGLAGVIFGLATARIVAAGETPTFLNGLGTAGAIVAGIAAFAAVFAWLTGDHSSGDEADIAAPQQAKAAPRVTINELEPDAPLAAWLQFLNHDSPAEHVAAIMQAAATRPDEIARLVRSADEAQRELALRVVANQRQIAPEVANAVCAEGAKLAAALRGFNEMALDDPAFHQIQVDLRSRFGHWKRAWWNVFHKLHLDGRPPLQELHDLAQARAHETSMREIVVQARAVLDAIAPSSDPP